MHQSASLTRYITKNTPSIRRCRIGYLDEISLLAIDDRRDDQAFLEALMGLVQYSSCHRSNLLVAEPFEILVNQIDQTRSTLKQRKQRDRLAATSGLTRTRR